MTTLIDDTHRLIALLKDYEFSDKQAEGLTRALREVDLSHISTKADLRELEFRLTLRLGSIVVGAVTVASVFLTVIKYLG